MSMAFERQLTASEIGTDEEVEKKGYQSANVRITFGVRLFEAIGCIYKVGGGIVFIAKLAVVIGDGDKRLTSLTPLLSHLK